MSSEKTNQLTAETPLFLFDSDGYFIGETRPQPNPVRPGMFFPKANATTIDPEVKDGFWSHWDGQSWSYEKKPTTPEELVGMTISHTSFTGRAIELRRIKDELIVPNSGYKQELIDNNWVVSKIPEPTAEEKKEKLAQEIRLKRDSMLSETDFLFLSDNPRHLSEDELGQVETYREALRQVPQQAGFPDTVEWPVEPMCL